MKILENTAANSFTQKLWEKWRRHGTLLIQIAVFITLIVGAYRLSVAFPALIWSKGAIDLKLRYLDVHNWFINPNSYKLMTTSVYPPATYVLLWPFLGWVDFFTARLIWAITGVILLIVLAHICIKESRAKNNMERVFVASLIFSLYPTGMTIFLGQLIAHLLPILLIGLITLRQDKGRLGYDFLSSILLVFPLIKPNIFIPFYWIVLFRPGRLRPMMFVVLVYTALTVFSASFQDQGVVGLIKEWLQNTENLYFSHSHANIHKLLLALGIGGLNVLASFIILLTLGIWSYLHREVNLWLIIGVCALTAHFWTYHRIYDDLLIVLPMIALFRIVKEGEGTNGIVVIAGLLFSVLWAIMLLTPSRILISYDSPLYLGLELFQTVLFLTVLLFLLYLASRERTKSVSD